MSYELELIFNIVGAASLAEVAVAFFAFPVAAIKVMTSLKRVKPFDCGLCMAFWLGLAGALQLLPTPIIYAGLVVLARQITYRIGLF